MGKWRRTRSFGDDTYDKSFWQLKVKLAETLIVQPSQWDLSLHVFVDALDVAIESVLMQENQVKWFRPVFYASCQLNSVEKNYSFTKREALGIIYSINKFWHYLLGNKFVFHVDHLALLYLVAKQALHGKIARWMLIPIEFEFTVTHTPIPMHAIVDYLSQLESTREALVNVQDDFLDVSVFMIVAINVPTTNWYDEMMQLFYSSLFPSTFSQGQHKRLALHSRHYKVIADHLYQVGSHGLLRWCVPPHEIATVLAEAHQGIDGGYFASDVTARKILHEGLWWPR